MALSLNDTTGNLETNIPQTSLTSISQTASLMGRDSYPSQSSLQMVQESLNSAIAQLEEELLRKLQQLLLTQEKKISQVAENINGLTQELEQAMLDFQNFAQVANQTYHSLQLFGEQLNNITDGNHQSVIPDELNIITTHPSKLPVVEKHGLGYILKDKTLNLSKSNLSIQASKSRQSLERWLEARRRDMEDKFSGI